VLSKVEASKTKIVTTRNLAENNEFYKIIVAEFNASKTSSRHCPASHLRK